MDRIPLSDESAEIDDDVVEEEGTPPGPEEQYKELDFDIDPETDYEPPLFEEFEDEDYLLWDDDGPHIDENLED